MLHPPAVTAPNPMSSPPPNCPAIRLGGGARHESSPERRAAANDPNGIARTMKTAQLIPEASPAVASLVMRAVGPVIDRP